MFTFGIEIEFKTDASRQAVAQALTAEGLVATSSGWTGENVAGAWTVKSDGSVYNGWEIVSPILTMADAEASLPAVARAIAMVGGRVDRECGFHVHIGGVAVKAMRNVIRRFINLEEVLDLMQPSRRRESNNTYCRSNVGSTPGKLDAIWRALDKGVPTDWLYTICPLGRYYKLNLHSLLRHGTIEVRHSEGLIAEADMLGAVRFWNGFCTVAATQERLARPRIKEAPAARVRHLVRGLDKGTAAWVKSRIAVNADL